MEEQSATTNTARRKRIPEHNLSKPHLRRLSKVAQLHKTDNDASFAAAGKYPHTMGSFDDLCQGKRKQSVDSFNKLNQNMYNYDQDARVPMRVKVWKHQLTGRKALDRFRRLVEFVLLTKQIFPCNSASKLTQQESILFFLDTKVAVSADFAGKADNQSSSNSPQMLFDVTPFKTIGEKNVTMTVKTALETAPSIRKDDQVSSTQHVMQTFSKFANYPQFVQRNICKHGWYARFEETRVMVRQGNRAEFYYFILSGIAISRSLDPDDDPIGSNRRRQRAIFLRKGDTIGEKEILQNMDRETTIVCKEAVEVLGLDKEVFQNIFRSEQGLGFLEFLKSIDDLKEFPLDLLQTSTFDCCVHHYRRGSVIVKNSNDSEWIYVIKSGSCQVYKAIKAKVVKEMRIARLSSSDDAYHSDSSEQLTLPPINQSVAKTDKRKLSRESLQISNSVARTRKKTATRTSSDSLPKINPNERNLVTLTPMEVTEDGSKELVSPRRKSKKARTFPESTSSPRETEYQTGTSFYAKLDILSEREVFGLPSLIHENTPSLSLVSNGAECILISKQFLRDNMDASAHNRMKRRIAAFPSATKLQSAMEEKLMWDVYKEKVMKDTFK